jgi:hypothetical protein
MNCRDIIIIEPGKRGGSPWVGSRRSTAYEVLDPGFRRGDDGCRPDLRHSRESGNPEG